MAKSGLDHREHSVLKLQRPIGNQPVPHMPQIDAAEPEAGSIGTVSPRFGHDVSRLAIHRRPAAEATQSKLETNTPDHEYEPADHVSGQAMPLAEVRPNGFRSEHTRSSESGQAAVACILHEVLASPGQPLDASARAFMEPRFGHDFGKIRVHTDSKATQSAAALNARAYTLGANIVFGQGEYAQGTEPGRLLLAHELAHSLQQQDTTNSTGRMLEIGDTSCNAERQADTVARVALASPRQLTVSRRNPPLAIQPERHPVIRRASVQTWAGTLDAPDDKYVETYQSYQKDRNDPQTKQFRPGVEIHITFTPNERVNAEEIDFVQTATAFLNGFPFAITPEVEHRMIPQEEVGAGTHIDVSKGAESPFVGQQFGVHFEDAKGKYTRNAETRDKPGIWMKEEDTAEMRLETAATAVKGVQKGAYYGAASWGWKREARQKPKKLPFSRAYDVPSAGVFLEAAQLWDVSKTAAGKPTIHLPTVDVKYTTKKTKLVDDPGKAGKKGAVELDINTRVEVTEVKDPAHKTWQNVIVVSGRHTGMRGWLKEPLSNRETEIMHPKKHR